MKLICWNVNSIKQRINHLEELIKTENPDLILLQEIKTLESNFPFLAFEHLGYNILLVGQKTFNGVAIFSKYPVEEVVNKLPSYNIDNEDEQARYIEISVTINQKIWRIISVYVPNGQEINSEKFIYKLKFYQRLTTHFELLNKYDENIVIAGDFNVANENIDLYDKNKLAETICCSLEERKAFRTFLATGLTDTYRIKKPQQASFSWWDYRANSYAQNKGLRIDYILTNHRATDFLQDSNILEAYRTLSKPSDHAPIMAKFKIT
ncbi:MAG: exodeoxyribonuclease III [Rickettsiales bacterium]